MAAACGRGRQRQTSSPKGKELLESPMRRNGGKKREKWREREDGWPRLGTDVPSDDLSDCLSLFPGCLGVAGATLAWDKHIKRPVN